MPEITAYIKYGSLLSILETLVIKWLFCCREENLQLILTRLYSKVNLEAKKNIINVDRYNILDGGKRGFNRKSFNTIAELSVRFSGEAAIDDGGPRREFARLSLMAIKDSPIFEGPPNSKILCPNVKSKYTRKAQKTYLYLYGSAQKLLKKVYYTPLYRVGGYIAITLSVRSFVSPFLRPSNISVTHYSNMNAQNDFILC